MKRGYFTPPVLIILAIIIFAVAIVIAINTDFVKRIKKEPDPVVQLPTTSPATQQSSPTTEETADWKSYSNNSLGIAFKYPKGWTVKEFSYTDQTWGISISERITPNNTSEGIGIQVSMLTPEVGKGTYEHYSELQINKPRTIESYDSPYDTEIRLPDLIIDGVLSLNIEQKSRGELLYKNIFIKKDSKYYSFTMLRTDSDSFENAEFGLSIFEKFLSTFQFLN